MKIIFGMLMLLSYMETMAQKFYEPCWIQKKKHSFEKGQVHIFDINNQITDSVVFSRDTMIGYRVYYRWGFNEHNYYYWAEDNDGTLWLCHPHVSSEEVLFSPRNPFVGYQVHYDNFEVTIIGVGEKRTLGKVCYNDLIIFEEKYISLDYEDTTISYFQKGVGWVAFESLPLSTTYLKCIKYR
jgi:hypothetical protein